MKTRSPCNNKCRARNGVCVGCKRTIEEIRNWRKYSDAEKMAVLERLKNEEQE